MAIAPFVLAVVTFGVAIWLVSLTARARVSLPAFIGFAGAVLLCQPLAGSGAPFLVDGAFSIVVGIATILPILECAAPAALPRQALLRGLLWGCVAGIGALSKVTFGPFGLLAAPCILWASLRHDGTRATLYKTASALLACVIPALMFLRYGTMYLGNGWRSSYGNLAAFYASGLSAGDTLAATVASTGPAYWIICGALLSAAVVRRRRDPERLALGLITATIGLMYLLAACCSQNSEPRFFWPVWFVVPLSLAGAIAPSDREPDGPGRLSAIVICLVAVIWSLPMLSRFDFRDVREARALLTFLRTDQAIRLEVASDPPFFNINTLLLAQQVDWHELWTVDAETVVYDYAYERPMEYSEQRLCSATYVVLIWPVSVPPAPEFTNRFVSRFLTTARACGDVVRDHPGPPDTLLFRMHGASGRN